MNRWRHWIFRVNANCCLICNADREINIPMLYVSHSLDEILHLADRVMVLENGQVKAFGALEEVWGSS